jgi:hypothetical protein
MNDLALPLLCFSTDILLYALLSSLSSNAYELVVALCCGQVNTAVKNSNAKPGAKYSLGLPKFYVLKACDLCVCVLMHYLYV